MKTWNTWAGFLVGLLCATGALAASTKPIPIEDRDAFEKQFIECVLAGSLNGCIVPLFVGHASPLFIEPEKGAQKFSALLQKLSREVGLYKVSSFRKTMKAGIYDDRVYLIEARSGSLACFRLVFRKVLGKWYVGTYRISGDEEASFKLLDLPLPKAIL